MKPSSVVDKKSGPNSKTGQALRQGVRSVSYISVGPGYTKEIAGEVADEALSCISVNGQELATFMCSPKDLDKLALGFLYNERLIERAEDVRSVHVSASDSCVDIWLHDLDFEPPARKIVTAGCGGGITFDDLSQKYRPLNSALRSNPNQIADLMRQMHIGAELYQRARGIHTAALAENNEILIQVEDVGRHNCLDRLAGVALIEGVSTTDRILLSSGRISSEMINKARRLLTPIVCSRTSPTALSVALASEWNITLVAYVRQDRMRIYSHPGRIDGF